MNNQDWDFSATISESKEQSITTAVEIMLNNIEKQQSERIIIRPKVSLLKGLLPILFYIISFVFLMIKSNLISDKIGLSVILIRILIVALYFFIMALCLKVTLLWLIKIYQKYAPEKIRRACCYEPSCSEYMMLAIKKYGVIRGVDKGCKRLSRCHWPNGGVDLP